MKANEWLGVIQQAADYPKYLTPLIIKYGEMLLQEQAVLPISDQPSDEARRWKGSLNSEQVIFKWLRAKVGLSLADESLLSQFLYDLKMETIKSQPINTISDAELKLKLQIILNTTIYAEPRQPFEMADKCVEEIIKLFHKNSVLISDEDIEKKQPCFYEPDNTTSMNCKHCGRAPFLHNKNIYNQ